MSKLNSSQRQAVLHGTAPLLVLAGAGTGKTTVITHRIAHFMEHDGISPRAILAVTFTNKAARDMSMRTSKLVNLPEGVLNIGTFHRICGRLLRQHATHLGLNASFVIYDDDDQLQLIRRCLLELNIDAHMISPQSVRQRLDAWKNQGQTPQTATISALNPQDKRMHAVYELYTEKCLQANAVDFGDMILHTITLFNKYPHILQQVQQRWSHLLVDEYQDTNPAQNAWLKLLYTKSHHLTVVGDDDQAIYRWRGADVGNILRFEQDFPGGEVIRLEQNYRCTQTVLAAANAVISNNVARRGKTLYAEQRPGTPLPFGLFISEREEAHAVASSIAAALAEGLSAADIAVLLRMNAQSRPIEEALRSWRIPYRIYGGLRFYDRKEIKDALAYLRLLVNPISTLDFLRVLNAPPRGIGKSSLDKLTQFATQENMSLLDAAKQNDWVFATLPKRAAQSLQTLLQQHVKAQASLAAGEHLGRLLERLLHDTGYIAYLKQEATVESQERLDNLTELIAALDEYMELEDEPSLAKFLEDVSLATDADVLGLQGGQVTMMTLHAAKGLEFEMVYLTGLEEGLLPHSRSLEHDHALEEERRLFYVGLTRAKETVMLSAAQTRRMFGRTQVSEISRFIQEIPQELLQFAHVGHVKAKSRQAISRSDDDAITDFMAPEKASGATRFIPGNQVFHNTFGQGQVLKTDGIGPQQKLTIEFPKVGRKVVVARFVERL